MEALHRCRGDTNTSTLLLVHVQRVFGLFLFGHFEADLMKGGRNNNNNSIAGTSFQLLVELVLWCLRKRLEPEKFRRAHQGLLLTAFYFNLEAEMKNS